MSKQKLWGGRFTKPTDPTLEAFSRSIQFDHKLARYDIIGSLCHVEILKKSGYLTMREAARLKAGLKTLLKQIKSGRFEYDPHAEDIHSDIQNKLQKKIGDVVLKLQTARSRNDQVVFATKLYCKDAIKALTDELYGLVQALYCCGKANDTLVIPGFTHLQHAQPVFLKDYCAAYAKMLYADDDRFSEIAERIIPTMGAGALAGTPIPAEKYTLKGCEDEDLDFSVQPTGNSLYSVSDRDFLIEILSALSVLAMHLSRFAEDLILWSSQEFDFVEIDEAFCTGSSLMPQKKNADSLELIRGNTGRIYGHLVSVLTMMKGLPLAYNRDMQLDKEPLFNSLEIVTMELKILQGLVKTLSFNKKKIGEHLKDESLYATDIVYYLVDRGVAFKDAHTIVGKLVNYSTQKDLKIKDMPQALLTTFSPKLKKSSVVRLFDPMVSVRSKKSIQRKK